MLTKNGYLALTDQIYPTENQYPMDSYFQLYELGYLDEYGVTIKGLFAYFVYEKTNNIYENRDYHKEVGFELE